MTVRGRAPEAAAPPPAPSLDRPPVGAWPGWRATLTGLWCTARPRQWLKNVLVFAAPGAAGVIHEAATLPLALGAFGAWCLVSSGAYLLNDALDAEADRCHPLKRHRPVALGIVTGRLAGTVGVALIAAGLSLPLTWGTPGLAAVLSAYALITVTYSLWMKNEPVIDLAAVASGFVLRAISGGVAVGVPISNWFFIVALFGSLFMVAGKRQAEYVDLREARGTHRAALDQYSPSFLRYVRSVSSSVAVAAYCLWAFEKAATSDVGLLFQLSIVPFVIGLFRYALLVDAGQGGAPEEIILRDRMLQAVGLCWAVLFAVGVYVA